MQFDSKDDESYALGSQDTSTHRDDESSSYANWSDIETTPPPASILKSPKTPPVQQAEIENLLNVVEEMAITDTKQPYKTPQGSQRWPLHSQRILWN